MACNQIKKILNLFILVLCPFFCVKCSKIIHQPTSSGQSVKYIFADRDTLLMRGHSTMFVEGYMDGCLSGQNAAGDSLSLYTKDEEHAKMDADYLMGWEQGKRFCYENMVNLIKHSGSNNPEVYHSKEAIELEKQRIWSELKK